VVSICTGEPQKTNLIGRALAADAQSVPASCLAYAPGCRIDESSCSCFPAETSISDSDGRALGPRTFE
jgi:hypothetical protein